MKLKKILPLAGLTSIAAIVAPLVTSCANKGTELIWNKGEEEPTPPHAAVTKFASWETATQAYFDAIDNDHMILSIDSVLDAIAYGDKLGLNTRKVTSRTDSVDKEEHTISTRTTIIGKLKEDLTIEYTYTFETKNVEYVVVPNYQFNNDTLTSHVFFQPLLVYEVDVAHRLYQEYLSEEDPAKRTEILEDFTQAIEVIMDHVYELHQDKNWYFYSSTETDGEFASQRVDYSNVSEYAYEAVYDYTLLLFDDFTILSQYFKDVEVGEN